MSRGMAPVMRAVRPYSVLAGVSVALPVSPSPAQLPEECACCAAPATHRSAMRRPDGASLLVGYCDECAEHQASGSSRVLALSLASLLLAVAGAAGLPLMAPQLGLLGLVLAVLALSALPLGALLLPAPLLLTGHAARGPAVRFGSAQRLLCAAPAYGARVVELNGGELEAQALREYAGSRWLCVGPAVGVAAACLSFFVFHPLLRILNLGSVRAQVAVDGRLLAAVDPTSNESPAAGALLRVPAGQHTLSVTSSIDGSLLGSFPVDLHSGAVHLFTIAGDDTCFWLETTGYGRELRATRSYEPLRSGQHFWRLPGGIDSWFAPSPGASDPNSRSSGGLLTALRQAACAEAPQEVRSAR